MRKVLYIIEDKDGEAPFDVEFCFNTIKEARLALADINEQSWSKQEGFHIVVYDRRKK